MDGRQPRGPRQVAWASGGAFAALCVSATACGPTQSTALIMDADVQLQAATTAEAEALAPYEWTAARQYLHKAREEQGYADYEVAIDFAEKARKYARDAKAKAMAAKAEGAPPNAGPGTVKLPAASEKAEN